MLSEFDSKDGSVMPEDVKENIIKLSNALQVIRDEVQQPISITSGYRSPEHNKRVGGAVRSTHVRGLGADFKVTNMTPVEVVEVIERLISEGKIPDGGLKAYSTWIHFDVRGVRARW
jgi:uncharacterized protein YcbK (DUF882 family)